MIEKLRLICSNLMFVIFTYGGRAGLNLGYSIPCFSCPFVSGCAGHCYLMTLQRQLGTGLTFVQAVSFSSFSVLLCFSVFVLLTILLSKMWCGWICPFGTIQDWMTQLRKKMGVRETEFSWKTRDRLKPIKNILLALLVGMPLLIAYAGLHSDFALPFCQICPGKPILPLFVGQTRHFALNYTNTITLVFSFLSITIAAATIIGSFFKDRFFCLFCPMLPLIQMSKKISLIRFEKNNSTCSGCGNCQRICPMDIRDVSMEKQNQMVMTEDCQLCFKCVAACPEDGALNVKFLNYKLYSSSRKSVAKNYQKGTPQNG